MSFMNDKYLLTTDYAKKLYDSYAKDMPICDYHCHLNPKEIYENQPFATLTEAWLKGDHYKWRLLRAYGIEEEYITGNQTDFNKFMKWAEVIENSIGNPVYTWCHRELQEYFHITKPLSKETAKEIYEEANQKLKVLKPRDMIEQMNVKIICTTDDPIDSLEYHELLAKEATSFRVYPSYRPDKALNIHFKDFNLWVDKLEALEGKKLNSYQDFKEALVHRLDYFIAHGCKVTDHGLDYFSYQKKEELVSSIYERRRMGEEISEEERDIYRTDLLEFLAKEYKKRNLCMQLHIGAMRNNNQKAFFELGPDTGFDAIGDRPYIQDLAYFLNDLEKENGIPKTIVYSLNDNDNRKLSALIGCFNKEMKGKMQLGSAWWFNDHKSGIYRQLDDLAEYGMLSVFVGMLTDSRSFLSYPRHDYFRRILCSYIANLVEEGLYPEDEAKLKEIIQNISFTNAMKYFEF